MSSEALSWAFKLNVKPSSVKFTLIALCECANYKTGRITPSIAHIEEITGQNRKTIISNIGELERRGLIADTGERVGRTGQIKVYAAATETPAEHKPEVHYVYRLTDPNTGEFYIGVRSCLGEPSKDSYRGSGSWPTRATAKGVDLHKEIISNHETRSEAEKAEADAIAQVFDLPLCRNEKEESHKRDTIPKTGPLNSPEITKKQSQKRDTEPSREPTLSNDKDTGASEFEIPAWVPAEPWADFIQMRTDKHGAPSARSKKAMITKLDRWRAKGHDPGEVLENATEGEWKGLWEPRKAANDHRTSNTNTADLARRKLGLG